MGQGDTIRRAASGRAALGVAEPLVQALHHAQRRVGDDGARRKDRVDARRAQRREVLLRE